MKPISPRLILPYLHNLQRAHMLQSYAAFFGGAALSLIGPMLVTVSFLLLSLSLIADHVKLSLKFQERKLEHRR